MLRFDVSTRQRRRRFVTASVYGRRRALFRPAEMAVNVPSTGPQKNAVTWWWCSSGALRVSAAANSMSRPPGVLHPAGPTRPA